MSQLYKCNYCDEIFSEPEIMTEMDVIEHVTADGVEVARIEKPYKYDVCPKCKSSDDLALGYACARCGEFTQNTDHLCDECKGELYKILSEFVAGLEDDDRDDCLSYASELAGEMR